MYATFKATRSLVWYHGTLCQFDAQYRYWFSWSTMYVHHLWYKTSDNIIFPSEILFIAPCHNIAFSRDFIFCNRATRYSRRYYANRYGKSWKGNKAAGFMRQLIIWWGHDICRCTQFCNLYLYIFVTILRDQRWLENVRIWYIWFTIPLKFIHWIFAVGFAPHSHHVVIL